MKKKLLAIKMLAAFALAPVSASSQACSLFRDTLGYAPVGRVSADGKIFPNGGLYSPIGKVDLQSGLIFDRAPVYPDMPGSLADARVLSDGRITGTHTAEVFGALRPVPDEAGAFTIHQGYAENAVGLARSCSPFQAGGGAYVLLLGR